VNQAFRVLALLLAASMAASAAFGDTPGAVQVGQRLQDAYLQGLNGPSRQLANYFGHPLIINVWASWCGPCRAELASLERLAWRGVQPTFTIIGISTDDDAAQARALLGGTNATISHFIDSRLRLENMLGANRLPLTVLVDAHGRVLQKIYGSRDWDAPEALALIRRAFKANESRPLQPAATR
jgi:thiol-disulfide isomerase/thioredoxin